jgi:hypothetical protein
MSARVIAQIGGSRTRRTWPPTFKLDHCRMAVCVGDSGARDFTNKTYPLPAPSHGKQAWNSLFIKNATTVTAITTATIQGQRAVFAMDGTVQTK